MRGGEATFRSSNRTSSHFPGGADVRPLVSRRTSHSQRSDVDPLFIFLLEPARRAGPTGKRILKNIFPVGPTRRRGLNSTIQFLRDFRYFFLYISSMPLSPTPNKDVRTRRAILNLLKQNGPTDSQSLAQ